MRLSFFVGMMFMSVSLISGEFDLFEERQTLDESVFKDHRANKLTVSYLFYPHDLKGASLGFSRYFGRKTGFFVESGFTETGGSLKEKADISAGIAYRFTKRARTWIFTGDLGFSVNDDVKDYDGVSKGFRLNHFCGKFNAEYLFKNDLGIFYSLKARIPLEFDLDEDVSPIHSTGLIYQF